VRVRWRINSNGVPYDRHWTFSNLRTTVANRPLGTIPVLAERSFRDAMRGYHAAIETDIDCLCSRFPQSDSHFILCNRRILSDRTENLLAGVPCSIRLHARQVLAKGACSG
jgi:hypothetical protein